MSLPDRPRADIAQWVERHVHPLERGAALLSA